MIYRVYEQDMLIIPLFLSERPRNEATYRDWKRLTQEISSDFDKQKYDQFQTWQGKL